MEDFDYTKIISVVVFAAIYLFLQWKSSKGAPKGVGDEGAEILEEFDFESFERESSGEPQPTSRPQRSRVESSASAQSARISPSVEEPMQEEENTESSKVDFDLRKAVIMSEILTPKFKNE